MDTCFLHGFLKAPLLIAQAKNPTISAETRRPLAAMIFGSDVCFQLAETVFASPSV